MIAVVILNWNGAEMLRRFLPSVVEHSHPLGEVIVADNGSTDNSLEILQQEFPEVRTLVLDRNYGFAEGYNEAFRRLEIIAPQRYEYYLLLNSDVRVTVDWLRPLQVYMELHPEVAAAQPKLRAEWAHDTLEYAGAAGGFIDRYGYPFCRGRLLSVVEKDSGQYDDNASIFWATGAALLIRQSDWWEVGGLDGRFFAHNEEIDLCWRLRARGRGIVCVPQSVVYHVGGGTLPQEHPRKTYLNFRNNLTMLFKNLPDAELKHVMRVRRFLDFVAFVQFLVKGDWANAKAVRKARRDFHQWQSDFVKDRQENLSRMVLNPIPERVNRSLIVGFFLKGQKTFSAFMQRS
jgi:glycosyltransferase, group 2 family protein